jgi:GNAT superfamily N-acetyltransferase
VKQETNAVVLDTAKEDDLADILALYRFLNPRDPVLPQDERLQQHWRNILGNDALHYVVARSEGRPVSTCALTIIPNLTRSARPYGLIENVVTHPDFRKRGIGTQVLRHALAIAWRQDCYKVMLLTSRKEESILRFYVQAGFVYGDKTGFVARPLVL